MRKITTHAPHALSIPLLSLKHKLDPTNFEQPEMHVCLEKFIFTYLWLLSELGELKHLVILAKALSILLPSCAQVSGPWVFTRHSSASMEKKKKKKSSQTAGYTSVLLCASTGFSVFLCYY